jgi:polysaccharide biosynthesis protein PelE
MNRVTGLLSLADLAVFALVKTLPAVSTGWFAFAHMGLTLAALWHWKHSLEGSRSIDMPVAAIGAAFGPCGLLIFTLMKPWSWISKRRRQLFYAPTRPIPHSPQAIETPRQALARMLDGRVRHPTADRIESLKMTLQYGDLTARRKALESIVRSFEPRLSPLLAIALADADQTIRALAAAASAQISFDVLQWSTEMEDSLNQNTSGIESAALVMFLASHGCHDVLLPQSQRVHLCRTTAHYLEDMTRRLPKTDKRQKRFSAELKMVEQTRVRLEISAAAEHRGPIKSVSL